MLNIVLELQTYFSQNVPAISYIFSQLVVIYLSSYLHIKQDSRGFNIYHVIFRDKIVTVLVLHIWNHLPETLNAKSSPDTFKRST